MKQVYHAPQSTAIQLSLFTRICAKCGIEKSLEEFELQEYGLYGRRATCMQCRYKQRRERKLHPNVKPVPRPGYKFCTKCEIEKPVDDFHVHKRGFAGRDPHCKECKNSEQSIRRDTPEYREYDRLNHQKRKTYYATHYLETKEEHQARGRAWRKAHPDKRREANLRRKSHKLKTIVEQVEYSHILERDGWICYICNGVIDPSAKSRTTGGLTFDHKVPLQPRKGEPQGTHTEDNIHPAHHACNVRKSNIPFDLLTSWQRRGI